jgi:hypothetical protein
MALRHQPRRLLRVPALAGLLLIAAGCDASGDTGQPDKKGTEPDTAASTPTKSVAQYELSTGARAGEPAPCPPGPARTWTLEALTTVPGDVNRDDNFALTDLVVSRTGTATAAFGDSGWVARTADDPPAPDDPQDPSKGLDETYLWFGTHLALDGADTQTLAYLDSVGFDEDAVTDIFDIVLTDRPPQGSWTTTPAQVDERLVHRVDLAVNASGAAAFLWMEPGTYVGEERLRAMYRAGAGASWTPPERVPVSNVSNWNVTIDDTGRVLLAYDRPFAQREGVYAMRRTAANEWNKPQRLGSAAHELLGVAQSAGGAVILVHGPVDGDGISTGLTYTSRMRPDGTWQAPRRQPARLGLNGLAIDARGRTLLAGWDRHTLRGRWSRPDGRWRKPFTIAADIAASVDEPHQWGLTPRLALNRRGDALATWAAGGRTPVVWARTKPAGRAWTPAVRVTPRNDPPQVFVAAIGDCGHGAFAWTTPGQPSKLQLRRATPTP